MKGSDSVLKNKVLEIKKSRMDDWQRQRLRGEGNIISSKNSLHSPSRISQDDDKPRGKMCLKKCFSFPCYLTQFFPTTHGTEFTSRVNKARQGWPLSLLQEGKRQHKNWEKQKKRKAEKLRITFGIIEHLRNYKTENSTVFPIVASDLTATSHVAIKWTWKYLTFPYLFICLSNSLFIILLFSYPYILITYTFIYIFLIVVGSQVKYVVKSACSFWIWLSHQSMDSNNCTDGTYTENCAEREKGKTSYRNGRTSKKEQNKQIRKIRETKRASKRQNEGIETK